MGSFRSVGWVLGARAPKREEHAGEAYVNSRFRVGVDGVGKREREVEPDGESEGSGRLTEREGDSGRRGFGWEEVSKEDGEAVG